MLTAQDPNHIFPSWGFTFFVFSELSIMKLLMQTKKVFSRLGFLFLPVYKNSANFWKVEMQC